jgi:hypothetical protein
MKVRANEGLTARGLKSGSTSLHNAPYFLRRVRAPKGRLSGDAGATTPMQFGPLTADRQRD